VYDVFNVDEAAYFYKALSRVSVCLGAAPALKINKSRMTFLVCSNAMGSQKLWLLVLGKSKKPHRLPEKPDSMDYVGTSEGWMNTPVFKEWLVELNTKMKGADRKVLLLYDNAPVHKEPDEAVSHVEIARLPKNTTALLPPMNQCVIAWIKARRLNDRSGAALLRVENDAYANVTGLRATHQLGATHKLCVTHTLSINQISVGGLAAYEYALDWVPLC